MSIAAPSFKTGTGRHWSQVMLTPYCSNNFCDAFRKKISKVHRHHLFQSFGVKESRIIKRINRKIKSLLQS